MTLSQPVFPKTTYFITRRCLDRRFYMTPSPAITQIVRYCLAVTAKRFNIELHAVCVMSNHYHLVLSDPDGVLPKFMERLNGMLGRSLNAHHGRSGYLFDNEKYSRPALRSEEDIIEKILYTLTNPLSAGLVEKGSQWPGLWVGPLGRIEERRPEKFFRAIKTQPDTAKLLATKPKALSMSDEEYKKLVLKLLRKREREIREEVFAKGRKFLGAKKVATQSPRKSPNTPKGFRKLTPRIVARCKELRRKLIEEMKTFVAEYREALKRFRCGEREVVFPAGTWLPRVRYGVKCAEP